MCYYATTDYRCGDWKWGNMKLRCPRQHRIGETCGARLVHHESVTKSPEDCRLCQEISIKRRRLQKERDNIIRWSKEGNRFAASIEKAQRESRQLEETILELYSRRPSVAMMRNGQASGLGVGQAGGGTNPHNNVNPYSSNPNYVSGGGTSGYSHSQTGYNVQPEQNNRHAPSHSHSDSGGRHTVSYSSGSGIPDRHSTQYSRSHSYR